MRLCLNTKNLKRVEETSLWGGLGFNLSTTKDGRGAAPSAGIWSFIINSTIFRRTVVVLVKSYSSERLLCNIKYDPSLIALTSCLSMLYSPLTQSPAIVMPFSVRLLTNLTETGTMPSRTVNLINLFSLCSTQAQAFCYSSSKWTTTDFKINKQLQDPQAGQSR